MYKVREHLRYRRNPRVFLLVLLIIPIMGLEAAGVETFRMPSEGEWVIIATFPEQPYHYRTRQEDPEDLLSVRVLGDVIVWGSKEIKGIPAFKGTCKIEKVELTTLTPIDFAWGWRRRDPRSLGIQGDKVYGAEIHCQGGRILSLYKVTRNVYALCVPWGFVLITRKPPSQDSGKCLLTPKRFGIEHSQQAEILRLGCWNAGGVEVAGAVLRTRKEPRELRTHLLVRVYGSSEAIILRGTSSELKVCEGEKGLKGNPSPVQPQEMKGAFGWERIAPCKRAYEAKPPWFKEARIYYSRCRMGFTACELRRKPQKVIRIIFREPDK